MKLADLATGSDVIVWIVFGIFAVISIILLFGHGSWLISGYNTASKEEKEKYDEKKLCRDISGECFVGDLEPIEYLAAYEQNDRLKYDWELVMHYAPKKIYYAHANEKIL